MSGYQYLTSSDGMQRPGYGDPQYNRAEEFDPSLSKISSMKILSAYCDSIYNTQPDTKDTYPEVANAVIRKRFYHGYSLYGFNKNYVGMLLSKATIPGLSAIVIPDDILKYPYAACSQQSIILMELLRDKGYTVRKVGFSGKITGHFTFEAYYNNDWHYFDPDKEPDMAVLKAYGRPSIAFLNANKEVLLKAYPQYSNEYVMDVFTNYSYGAINSFPAPRAFLFQKVTTFLSYTIWIFFLLAFIWTRKQYKKAKRSILSKKTSPDFSTLTSPASPAYYAA